jgi:tRNA(Ile2) C34 agmatinyltransferase TiaS
MAKPRCKKCGIEMKRGYSFNHNGITKYWRCPKCDWISKTRTNVRDLSKDMEFLGGSNGNFIHADRTAGRR